MWYLMHKIYLVYKSNPLLLLTQSVEIITDHCVNRQVKYLRAKPRWGISKTRVEFGSITPQHNLNIKHITSKNHNTECYIHVRIRQCKN